MTAPTRSLAGIGLALLVAGALTACATPVSPGSGSTSAGTPSPSATADADIDLEAAWLDNGRMIALVTQGSSTCVPTAGEVAYANGVLDVELVDPAADTPCTRDFAPRVTLVGLPEGVDPTQSLEVRVTGEGYAGDTDLDGVDGLDPSGETDYLPSAGWLDDGQFVILTWGSSGCPPVLEKTEATGPAEVTVTFATPPADRACTMDMAPRATLAAVEGLDEETGAVAILVGDEFADARVDIIGD